jgi:hypothetical protein
MLDRRAVGPVPVSAICFTAKTWVSSHIFCLLHFIFNDKHILKNILRQSIYSKRSLNTKNEDKHHPRFFTDLVNFNDYEVTFD